MRYVDHEIEATLLAWIREECLPKNRQVQLEGNDNLFDHGIVDSAGLISFIGFVEREFGITIPDEDLLPQNFASVDAIAGYIRSHQKAVHATN